MFKEKNTAKWFISRDIAIKESTISGAGRGIFAINDIPAHTVIEQSPVLIVHPSTFLCLNESFDTKHLLSEYPFQWADGNSCIAFGWGSFYNHNPDANVSWKPYTDGYNAMVFTAKRDIKSGEELFIRYSSNPDGLWFVDENSHHGYTTDTSSSGHFYSTAVDSFLAQGKEVRDSKKKREIVGETLGDWSLDSKK